MNKTIASTDIFDKTGNRVSAIVFKESNGTYTVDESGELHEFDNFADGLEAYTNLIFATCI